RCLCPSFFNPQTLLKSSSKLAWTESNIGAREDEVDHSTIKDSQGDEVEKLLKKTDPEVLAQLRSAQVRNALLEKMKQYQTEATAQEIILVDDFSEKREVVEESSWVWEWLREHMDNALAVNNHSLFLEDVRIAESFHSLVNKKKALATEMLGFSPKTAFDFQRGFTRALPEWKEAFPKYVSCARRRAYIGTVFFGSVENYFPFNLEEEEDSAEDSMFAKQEAELFFQKTGYLIEKARTASNPVLSEDTIRATNAEYDLQNARIDQQIEQLRQTRVRSKEFQEHQQFLVSLHNDLQIFSGTSGLRAPFDAIQKRAAERLLQEHSSVTLETFVNSQANSSADVPSKWKTQQKDYDAFQQKVNEACDAHLTGNTATKDSKLREAHSLDALSQLRFDATPGLDSMREKLMAAYEKIISFSSFERSKNFECFGYCTPWSFGPATREIYEGFLKLAGEAVQALGEGRTQAVDASTPLLEKHKVFLTNSSLNNRPKPLLLRAEARVLSIKMKTEPAMRQIVDEEIASFPWNFEKPYHENLENLQRIQAEGNLETAKAEKLQALKNKLASEVAPPLSSRRPTSQFPVTFLTGEARASELRKLQAASYRTVVVVEANELSKRFGEILGDRKFDIVRNVQNQNKDPLLRLLEGQINKIQSASSRSEDAFLKAIEETKLLYPYVEKKIELCRRLMGIDAGQWWYEYSGKIEPFWNTMNAATKSVLTQLDQLAASRLLAEQTITQNNDPYLTHALDEIRNEDERKFQDGLTVLGSSERPLQEPLRQTRNLCSRIAWPALFTAWSLAGCYLLWALYFYNTSPS
ncbi:MAG: hypothetical protein K2W97_08430, partial [Chthoniobacterales bacterium]|nr:hypothetical protein [Chthoniobacterales bacterium]